MTNDTIFTWEPYLAVACRILGTSSSAGPFNPIVCTIEATASGCWAEQAQYSWKQHDDEGLRLHLERSLLPSSARWCTSSGPNGLAPAVASPNIDVTVSPTPLYTSQTNSRNGATSDSSDGLSCDGSR